MSFPLYQNKSQLPSVVRAEQLIHYMKERGHLSFPVPESITFIYSHRLVKKVQSLPGTKTFPFLGAYLHFIGGVDEGRVAVISGFGIGAPSLVTKLEELAAFGVKTFVSVGTAGSIDRRVAIGDLVLCEEALRDEGSSYHYLPPETRALAHPELLSLLEKFFVKNSLNKFKVGKVWTTDCPYRESALEIEYFRGKGACLVDMEVSAFFAVSQFLNLRSAAVLVASDFLSSEGKWEIGFHQKAVKRGIDDAFVAVLQLLEGKC